jgi:predicted phage baseplate assembly protein
MRLPEVKLDDRRFQDLVNEARLRVQQKCPEWSEHNVSDPGITLIEVYAWMVEQLIYRLNRVPEKLHVELMNLLGITREPPTCAYTDVRFRLSAPAVEPVAIPARTTEVGTLRTPSEESVIFQTTEDVVIPAAVPIAYSVRRGRQFTDIAVADGIARPTGPDQLPFNVPPAIGDALYLGFSEPLPRLLLQVDVECSPARGGGVDPEDPPLIWEISTGEGDEGWARCEVLADRTGGFNYGSGAIELELPAGHAVASLAGHRAYWVRCSVSPKTRRGKDVGAEFKLAPEIYSITARPIGARIRAEHSSHERGEVLGQSDGTPAQTFPLRRSPVLELERGETLEVVDPQSGVSEPWEARESFVESRADDRHYVLDLANGEVQLGAAVRRPEGGWRQYGAVPPKGAVLRFTRYRHGGGRRGNVAAGALCVLKSAIPGVATVTNPVAAHAGVDLESLDSTRRRASMEIRTRYRAVTAEDYEFLAGEASPRVARAVCLPPLNGGGARVRIVPRVEPADRRLELAELTPDAPLLEEVGQYLDERRLIGTTIDLDGARFRGVSVVVNIQVEPRADLDRVEKDVAHALYTYLNPLVGGSQEGIGTGWAFGRSLNQGELYGIVHATEGVELVKILRVYETDLATGVQSDKPAGSHLNLEADELIASGMHNVKADRRELA